MKKITFRQVEAFRAVVISGTVIGAAEILFISQPAISRLLSDFEESINIPLFVRQKKKLIPTPEALILFEETERSFVGMEKLAQIAEELQEFHRGTLRIACMPALAQSFIPNILREFIEKNTGVSMTLQMRSSHQIANWIASEHFDVGLSSTTGPYPSIKVEQLVESELVCILHRDHPLSSKAQITPKDLENETFISLGIEQSIRYKVDELFEVEKIKRRMSFDTQVSHIACTYVLGGSGVSLVDPVTAVGFIERGLVVKPFIPSIPFDYHIIIPSTRPPSLITIAFIKLVKQGLIDLSQKYTGLFVIKNNIS